MTRQAMYALRITYNSAVHSGDHCCHTRAYVSNIIMSTFLCILTAVIRHAKRIFSASYCILICAPSVSLYHIFPHIIS